MNRTDPQKLTLRADHHSACRDSKFRARRLAACVAAAVSPAFLIPSYASYPPALHDPAFLAQPLTGQPHPSSPNPPWIVQNCDDDGTGSLRHVIGSVAQSGDTVDLSQLTCSTISLTSGQIVVTQDDLTLVGPDAAHGSLSISGNDASRVFNHIGLGQLGIESLTITHGYYSGTIAYGGCIASSSNVYLRKASVTQCTASGVLEAAGGGIVANGDVTLLLSTISDNEAIAPAGSVIGGGVKANRLIAKYSSITGNHANAGLTLGTAGGAYSHDSMVIYRSTIESNTAISGGGLFSSCDLSIVDSTISGNVADSIAAVDAESLTPSCSQSISNTTIAFNHANLDTSYGAFYFFGSPNSTLPMQSSIIADNTRGASNTPSDLYIEQGTLTGADNLIITTNQSPPNVIKVTTDPKLGPLQSNGGWTRTHALLPGSPAIGMGNNSATQLYDQRGFGYPRTTGAAASTDIGAFQFDSIFANRFD